jgi:hypothetical protein
VPEARYAYYRRCQVFRRNGEQCKAPAETGAHICYAHARQQAMEARRRHERRVVLEEAALIMRQRGHDGFDPGQIFTDFSAIQTTLGVVMRAIINGRIDSKTAGRLLWELQIAAKLLRLQERATASLKMRHSNTRSLRPTRALAKTRARFTAVGMTNLDMAKDFQHAISTPAVPRAAEQILQPHAGGLEDRRCHAGSASGWHLDRDARTPRTGVIVMERAA